jgi:hypothetical protein
VRTTFINKRNELKDPRELIQTLISIIAGDVEVALKSGAFDEIQKRTAKAYLRNIRKRYAAIEKVIDSCELHPTESFPLFIDLSALLFEVHGIGSLTTISDPVKKFIRMGQAKLARDSRGKSSREPLLVAAIKAEIEARATTDAMAVSEKFAGMIRPGVLSRLEIKEEKGEKKWPSVSTIKQRLADLKKGSNT